MIHLVSLNPALDYSFKVKAPVRGKIGKVLEAHVDAGGKALNVSRFLGQWKVPRVTWLGTGGGTDPTHLLYRALLEKEGLKARFLGGDSPVRANLVLEKSGSSAKYNHAGIGWSAPWPRLLRNAVKPNDILVMTGSIPPHLKLVELTSLIRTFERKGIKTVVDGSGEPLRQALKAKPWFFKVNLFEISEALGWKIGGLDQALSLIPGVFRGMGLDHGALTDGKNGAVLWENGETVRVALGTTASGRMVVGAGDAFLAGYLRGLQLKMDLEQRAKLACAAGSVAALKGIAGFDAGLAERLSRRVKFRRIA